MSMWLWPDVTITALFGGLESFVRTKGFKGTVDTRGN